MRNSEQCDKKRPVPREPALNIYSMYCYLSALIAACAAARRAIGTLKGEQDT